VSQCVCLTMFVSLSVCMPHSVCVSQCVFVPVCSVYVFLIMKVKNLRILVVLLWKWRKHFLMWMQPGNVYVTYILNVIVFPLGSENKTFGSLSFHINSRHCHLFLPVHHWFRSTRDTFICMYYQVASSCLPLKLGYTLARDRFSKNCQKC